MLRPLSLAARTSLAAVLALATVAPARAQTAAEPAQPQADAVTPPPPAAAPPAPVAEIEPLVAQVRQAAAAPARSGVVAADRAAVAEFYAGRTAAIWVTADGGFTPRARHAMAEIAKADDWGLEARAFELPRLAPGETSLPALADAEVKLSLAVLKYARHARGGRLDPAQLSRNFDQKPTLREPKVVMDAVAATETPGTYLRDLHPKHVQFERLRHALLKARGSAGRTEERAEAVVRLPADGPTLKLGMSHPHVALLRQRLKLAARSGDAEVFDRELQEAVRAFQERNNIQPTGALTGRTRAALNGPEAPKPAFGSEVQRIIVNMERWRWMPEDLGTFYVWDNVPEFQSRVVKRGQTIHQMRIVVGKPDTQTTLFSANMRYIVFGPEWGVPDSIKVKEILPYLRPNADGGFFGFGGGTDTRVLQRHNLRVSYNGKPVDASQVDWQQVDIRRFTFIQPAGPGNVLGGIKFRFPNKHDIYMHDTPQRDLFDKAVRAYSHGCIRVQNPGRLAEILLEEDKGWSAAHVRDLLARGGNNEITLTRQIPVHITYFTAMVDDDGRLQSFGDIYGHDNRVAMAMAGRPLPLEAPSVASAPLRDSKEARRAKATKQTSNDFFSGLFGN
ncbi:MAG: L,D-transpeptidase family protein [Hyphomonadaceae bacterium]|nr:L,D-transpeptidase family protein [Hyphomonadaceae bacterium]